MRDANDPLPQRVRAALDSLFGDKVERLVLYGSRARGDARADSDYDFALFLRDFPQDRLTVRKRVAEATVPFLYEDGAVVNVLTLPAGSMDRPTLLMHEIRKDGREIL